MNSAQTVKIYIFLQDMDMNCSDKAQSSDDKVQKLLISFRSSPFGGCNNFFLAFVTNLYQMISAVLYSTSLANWLNAFHSVFLFFLVLSLGSCITNFASLGFLGNRRMIQTLIMPLWLAINLFSRYKANFPQNTCGQTIFGSSLYAWKYQSFDQFISELESIDFVQILIIV